MKIRLSVVICVLCLSVILSACGLFFDERGFENALETAIETGDYSEYNVFVCEEDLIPYTDEPAQFDYAFDCRTLLNSLNCEATVESETFQVLAEINGDLKACNVRFRVGEEEVRLRDLADLDNSESTSSNDKDTDSGLDSDTLEAAIEKTFNEGDPADMNETVCEAEQTSQEAANQFTAISTDWTIECSVETSNYECRFTGEGMEIVFSGVIEEDVLCNSTVTIDGQEIPLYGDN